MKKIFKGALSLLFVLCMTACGGKNTLPKASPNPNSTFGVDKNINIETIDKYLGRKDTVYYDMRMMWDPATYCNIGGDAYLSGFVKGFEVIPYPYLATVTGLPEAVGEGYKGPSLFTITDEGEYVANYKESLLIIEDLFPKDKKIFLMCGGGGYAMMTKNLLVALGYDKDKIYNVGGFWEYSGKNRVKIDVTYGDGLDDYYAWHRLDYHVIDFSYLTPVAE